MQERDANNEATAEHCCATNHYGWDSINTRFGVDKIKLDIWKTFAVVKFKSSVENLSWVDLILNKLTSIEWSVRRKCFNFSHFSVSLVKVARLEVSQRYEVRQDQIPKASRTEWSLKIL